MKIDDKQSPTIRRDENYKSRNNKILKWKTVEINVELKRILKIQFDMLLDDFLETWEEELEDSEPKWVNPNDI